MRISDWSSDVCSSDLRAAKGERNRQAGHCLDCRMMLAAMPKHRACNRHGGAFETSPFRGFGEVSIAPLQPQSPAMPPIFRNGTALAINYFTSGVAALSACSTGRGGARNRADRSEEHTSELQSLMRISYAVFCL